MSIVENIAYLEGICKTSDDASSAYHIAAAALNEAGNILGIAANELREAPKDESKEGAR